MPDPSELPRVLILCDEPINRIGGGGVTMGNLFRGWPKDRLAQIWAHHRFEIDTEICPTYLRLGAHALPGDRWVPDSLRRQRELVKRLRPFLRPGIRLNYRAVRQWAQGFAPDLIYSQATPYPMYTWWLPRWLARDLRVPLVNHVMDDWPAAMSEEWMLPLRRLLKLLLRRELRLLFGAAASNLAISKEMADAYLRRYGYCYRPFQNAIDLDEWSCPKTQYGRRSETFQVVYLGALAENMQVLSLRDIGVAIDALARRGEQIQLTVYTGAIFMGYFEQYLGHLSAVSHGGTVPRRDLCRRLSEADLLVLPVNFDRRSVALNQYSMPTKVPEYMASGTPILVYAPGHVPPAAYARQEEWGYVVDQQDRACLERALAELGRSAALRARLGTRAREIAVRNHDARVVRWQFRALLQDVARSPLPSTLHLQSKRGAY